MEKYLIKRRLFCCLLLFITACNYKVDNNRNISANQNSISDELNIDEDFKAIAQAKKFVKQGDLILRTGRDFTSDMMRRMSTTDKTYSHCGIASFENDTLFVYHAIGGEWNPDQKLRRDTFEFFCNPYENKGFGIFRYSLSNNEQLKVDSTIQNFYNSGTMFDMQFNLETNDRLYCSEFVYKTIEIATSDRVKISVDTMNSIKFIAVDNLFINAFCKQITRIKFPE